MRVFDPRECESQVNDEASRKEKGALMGRLLKGGQIDMAYELFSEDPEALLHIEQSYFYWVGQLTSLSIYLKKDGWKQINEMADKAHELGVTINDGHGLIFAVSMVMNNFAKLNLDGKPYDPYHPDPYAVIRFFLERGANTGQRTHMLSTDGKRDFYHTAFYCVPFQDRLKKHAFDVLEMLYEHGGEPLPGDFNNRMVCFYEPVRIAKLASEMMVKSGAGKFGDEHSGQTLRRL